jgi:hypothetical protein
MFKKILNILFWYLPHDLRRLTYRIFAKDSFLKHQNKRVNLANDKNASSYFEMDKLKCIFVHIPKAAGVSVNRTLYGNMGGSHTTVKAYSLVFSKRDFDRYFKFTIVRNPYHRIISAFSFLEKGGLHENDMKIFKSIDYKFSNINDFILNYLNKDNIYMIRHFIPQFEFVMINSKIQVDMVLKFENIDDEFPVVLKRIGLFDKRLLKLNSSRENPVCITTILNRESIIKINHLYRKDFEFFNYSFLI